MIEDGEIKKVTVEYENTTYIATGKDATRWIELATAADALLRLHNPEPKYYEFKWSKIKKNNEQKVKDCI